MPKRARRWNEYPQIFGEALDWFREDLDRSFWRRAVSRSDAFTYKTQFYRYFEAVRTAYDDSEPEVRKHTGLGEFYQLVNNLVVSAVNEAGNWYIQLRRPGLNDPLHRMSVADEEFIHQASKAINKQVQEEDDAFYFNLLSGGKREEGHIGGVSSEVEALPGFQEMFGPTPQKKE